MRFHCGETKYQRDLRRWQEAKAYYEKWHHKFAWWPTRLDDGKTCVWLEFYDRQGTWHDGRYPTWTWRRYAIYTYTQLDPY